MVIIGFAFLLSIVSVFEQNIFIFFHIGLEKFLKICYHNNDASFLEEVLYMAKCEICGKGVTFGIKVSHSHRRSNRTWKPNIKRVKAIVNGSPKRIYTCTRCLRSGKVERAI